MVESRRARGFVIAASRGLVVPLSPMPCLQFIHDLNSQILHPRHVFPLQQSKKSSPASLPACLPVMLTKKMLMRAALPLLWIPANVAFIPGLMP